MNQSLVSQRLVGLFFAAAAVFNFPLIALWDAPVRVFGIPLFPFALFALWALMIVLLALIVEHAPD